MHFSSSYTSVVVRVMTRQRQPQTSTRHMAFTLHVVLELNLFPNEVNQDGLNRLLTNALMQRAGGTRTIGGAPYEVSWTLVWGDAATASDQVERGRALGVALVTEGNLGAANADGMYSETNRERGPDYIHATRRVLLMGDIARDAIGAQRRAVVRFGNAAVHEIAGHALGLPHREDSVMAETNTTTVNRLSDDQIEQIYNQLMQP